MRNMKGSETITQSVINTLRYVIGLIFGTAINLEPSNMHSVLLSQNHTKNNNTLKKQTHPLIRRRQKRLLRSKTHTCTQLK